MHGLVPRKSQFSYLKPYPGTALGVARIRQILEFPGSRARTQLTRPESTGTTLGTIRTATRYFRAYDVSRSPKITPNSVVGIRPHARCGRGHTCVLLEKYYAERNRKVVQCDQGLRVY